jgi:hypothetical protein
MGSSDSMPEISADVDGCIRRTCADCGKHFASFIDEREPRDTYWCPYCGQQLTWDRWFTPAQQAYFEDVLAEDALAVADQELNAALTEPPPRSPFHEATTDLVSVAVPCHPGTKLKLEPSWSKGLRCHLCGAQSHRRRAALGRVRLRRRES